MTKPAGKTLEQLSPDAQQAAQSRSVSGAWDLKHLLKLLGDLALLDQLLEEQTKKAQSRMVLCIVLAFISLFAGVFLASITMIPLLVPPLMVALAVMFGVKYRAGKKGNLLNDFRTSLRPALRDLAGDLAPDKKIKAQMDLSGAVEAKQKGKRELPPGRYQKLEETLYEDPWCEVRLPLVDGCTAVLEFENCYRKLQRRYWRHIFPHRNRARHINRHVRALVTRTPEPFFLYAIYWDMHLPYAARESYAARWLPPGVTLR